jgi:hypothetical protein
LYLGDLGSSSSIKGLNAYGIKYILTCGVNMPPLFPERIKYMVLNVLDYPGEDLSRFFD